jgi:hypothetical protein
MNPLDQAIALITQVLRIFFEFIISILRLFVTLAEKLYGIFF